MQVIASVLAYKRRVYLRTNQYVMPFTLLLVFLGALYAVKPTDVVDSFTLSLIVLYFLSAWIGFSYQEMEDPIAEQVLLVKIGRPTAYYVADTLFMLLIGAAAALLAVGFPLVVNAVNGFTLYLTPLTLSDVLYAYGLHLSAAFMGASVGALFHPRILSERKLALLLVCCVMVVGFVQIGIHDLLPLTRWVTWLFPPISRVIDSLSDMQGFQGPTVLLWTLVSLLYGAALSLVKIGLLLRRKFG